LKEFQLTEIQEMLNIAKLQSSETSASSESLAAAHEERSERLKAEHASLLALKAEEMAALSAKHSETLALHE
jgi:hypothetical protein